VTRIRAKTVATFLAIALFASACGIRGSDVPAGCASSDLPAGAAAGAGEPSDAGQPFAGRDISVMSFDEVIQVAGDAKLALAWRYSYETSATGGSYSECWCVPPPDGRVASMFYDDAGRLIVFVASDRSMFLARPQPENGWGCS